MGAHASPKRTQTPRSHSVPSGQSPYDMIGRRGACCLIVRRHDRHGRVFPVGSIDTLPHSLKPKHASAMVRNYRLGSQQGSAGFPSPHCRPMIRTFLTRDDNHHNGPHGAGAPSKQVRPGEHWCNCHQEYRSPSTCSVLSRCNRLGGNSCDLTCIAAGPTQVNSAQGSSSLHPTFV